VEGHTRGERRRSQTQSEAKMTMHGDQDGDATFTVDRMRMFDIRQAAGRAGVEPRDFVDLAIRRYLDELEPEHAAGGALADEPAEQELFFDWTR
jgi:hypothetical protein